MQKKIILRAFKLCLFKVMIYYSILYFEKWNIIYKSKQGLNQHNVLFLLGIEKIDASKFGYIEVIYLLRINQQLSTLTTIQVAKDSKIFLLL